MSVSPAGWASWHPVWPGCWAVGLVVVGLAGMAPQVPRISMTLPCLNAARAVVFTMTGVDKAATVARVFGDRFVRCTSEDGTERSSSLGLVSLPTELIPLHIF